jgi:hypothetical protein
VKCSNSSPNRIFKWVTSNGSKMTETFQKIKIRKIHKKCYKVGYLDMQFALNPRTTPHVQITHVFPHSGTGLHKKKIPTGNFRNNTAVEYLLMLHELFSHNSVCPFLCTGERSVIVPFDDRGDLGGKILTVLCSFLIWGYQFRPINKAMQRCLCFFLGGGVSSVTSV